MRFTADSIWKHRQDFWTKYYQHGYIAEAWAVLGRDAERYVQRHYRGVDLAYGRLTGQYDDNQSVLLLKIGDMLFCEWSHNGKLRAINADAKTSPELYKSVYDSSDLRFDSFPFLSSTGQVHLGLPHLHSENRWWQTTAAKFISNKLGIHL